MGQMIQETTFINEQQIEKNLMKDKQKKFYVKSQNAKNVDYFNLKYFRK